MMQTDLALLPYSVETYALRGPGVALECFTYGLPMLVSVGATMEELSVRQGGMTAGTDEEFAEAMVDYCLRRSDYQQTAIASARQADNWMVSSDLPHLSG
jgi:hypothetical protein